MDTREKDVKDLARELYVSLAEDMASDAARFNEAVRAAEFFESAWARQAQGLPIDTNYLQDED